MAEQTTLKARVQKLGSYLSSMVMPNIGAFIAWGIITALFIPTGWLPNAQLANMVGPMQLFLLPILIGYTGGTMVYGQRGGVVGAIATAGAIVGATDAVTGNGDVPMFIGAMVMGPLGGWVIKKFDEQFQDKIAQGFEMLVNNFSSGILGFILAILGFFAVGPFVQGLTAVLSTGVEWIVARGLLPLANIFIEPGKVLFLNNAINHGILTPLGSEQVKVAGKSVLYLLEANPGPGLGILVAYMMFGKGSAKSSAPGAAIIHFFGGIHEIYFPYVMMKPLMILAAIAGGVTGTFLNVLFNVGLTGPSSPGSIIAISGMTARGDFLGMLAAVAGAAVVSFLVAATIIRMDKSAEDDFEKQKQATAAAKAQSKGQAVAGEAVSDEVPEASDINKIIFACDAGMGSSAMGASLLRKKAKAMGLDKPISNSAINNLVDASDTLVITQEELTNRARKQAPSAIHVSVENFLDGDRYDELLSEMMSEPVAKENVTTVANASHDHAFDAQKVKHVYVAYDEKVGASTMGASLLRNAFVDAGIKLPVEAKDISQIPDAEDVLVIAEGPVMAKVQQKLTHVQINHAEDLLDEQEYQAIAKEF